MSEEAKKAIEELVRVTSSNDFARVFLLGYKGGLETAKAESANNNGEPTRAAVE